MSGRQGKAKGHRQIGSSQDGLRAKEDPCSRMEPPTHLPSGLTRLSGEAAHLTGLSGAVDDGETARNGEHAPARRADAAVHPGV